MTQMNEQFGSACNQQSPNSFEMLYRRISDDFCAPRIPCEKEWNSDYIGAIIHDAFKNGIVQEAGFGPNGYVFHESLARPVDHRGRHYSIQEIADQCYAKGLHVDFDRLTSANGIKHAQHFPLTLNISVKSALTPSFFDCIKERLERHGVAAEDIIFEILEHDVPLNASIDHLYDLKAEGFRFALDDFAYAHNDPELTQINQNRLAVFFDLVDFIKIDGPLIRAHLEEENHAQFHEGDLDEALNNLSGHYFRTGKMPILIAERVYDEREAYHLFARGFSGVQGRELSEDNFSYAQT